MKKILLLTSFALAGNLIIAQDNGEKDIKNVRFGLIVTPAIDWYKPDEKIMARQSVVPKIGGGLSIEFRLAKVASLVTGIEINMDGGKIQYANGGVKTQGTNTVSYWYSKTDDEIVDYNTSSANDLHPDSLFDKTHTKYQLNEREFKTTYVTIPFGIKLKTKEIGVMTYFGQVGLNSSFRWKAKAKDGVTELETTSSGGSANETKSNVNITKEMNFYVGSLHLGAGCEMNLSGTTSLLIGLHYNLGFTSVTKKESVTLEKQTNGPNFNNGPPKSDYTITPMPQTLKSNGIVLTVGILF